jgi:hypothetical protein
MKAEAAAPPALVQALATHYGPAYQGQPLGCGTGYYSSDDPAIVAVGPSRYGEWFCGQTLRVCGAAGCITGTRQDSCPGCDGSVIDLSEAGIATVCGAGTDVCRVTIEIAPDSESP